MSTQDNYEQGEIGETSDFGVFHNELFSTLEALYQYVIGYYGTPEIFDDRLEICQHETGDGNIPTDYGVELWKRGKKKLYTVNYIFYITKVEKTSLNHANLVNEFPKLIDNGY